jgi:acyl-coenzyme A thioesterase PaaI-like protein
MKHFKTDKTEGVRQKLRRILFNRHPNIRGTGSYITFLSDDWKEVQIKLPLSWRTKNVVGTVFGGSIYASTDPFYMLQLMNILGKEYVVWDKSASVRFRKPIKETVYAQFLIKEELLIQIKETVAKEGTIDVNLSVDFKDRKNVSYASISKKIYIASKEYYKQKQNFK